MKFFTQKKIIKTNPSERPKIRFEKVLFHQLEKEGYKYLKSKNEYVQNFEFGKRIISLSYNSSFGFIRTVQYFSKIIFSDLEKSFKKIYPKYGKINCTIHHNHHWTDSWMCNSETGEYTDKTINNLADEFFKEIKPEIDNLFANISDYKSLEKTYNSRPNEYVKYIPNLEKQIINGLILVKTFHPNNYNLLKKQYLLRLEKHKSFHRKDLKKEIKEGIRKIEKDNITIDNH